MIQQTLNITTSTVVKDEIPRNHSTFQTGHGGDIATF